MKTKILSAILILCLILSCVACGKPDKEDGTTAPSSPTSPSSPTTPTIPGNNNNIPSAPPVTPDKVALTVNGIEISAIELNYFYMDAINEYVSQYGQFISYILDITKPLSQQYLDKEITWAEHFLNSAINSAKNSYALYSAAAAAGHTLSKDEEDAVSKLYDNMANSVKNYGYKNVDEYLLDIYGAGSSFESYKSYFEVVLMASSYYSAYTETLKNSYTPAILREFEGNESYKYNSYTYYTYFLDAKRFKDTESLQQAAKELSDAGNNTVDKLNATITKIEKQIAGDNSENGDKKYPTAIENKDKLYSGINASLQEWLRDSARQEGDIGAFPNYASSDNKALTGYYIVMFKEVKDNQFALANVRHILVAFEGGTYDKTTGQTIYTENEKNKAKNEALLIYDQWLNGDQTEENFSDLAKKYTDDGNGDVGGIYYDIYPGQMVQTFNDWCFDESRQSGDHGMVETEYGWHIMFYSGDSETTYRDFMVSNDKLTKDMEDWQKALLDSAKLETIDTSAVNIHYVIYTSK
jgi:hypothetical protein